jgi:hypothetical protein
LVTKRPSLIFNYTQHWFQAPQPTPFKLTINESIDRIKEEFNFLQAQYNRYSSAPVAVATFGVV